MGLFSSVLSSLGRSVSDKIGDKISDTINNASFGNSTTQEPSQSIPQTTPVQQISSINDLPAPTVIPSISSDSTVVDIFGRKISFSTLSPTCFWNSEDDFGAGEIDTVFIYSPNGASLEDTDYQSSQKAKIVFQTSPLSPDKLENTKNTVKKLYNVDNVTIQKLENSIFMYKITGESSSSYAEIYYLEYDGDFEGEISKVYYDITFHINKNLLSKDEQYIAKHEFETIINTLKFEN